MISNIIRESDNDPEIKWTLYIAHNQKPFAIVYIKSFRLSASLVFYFKKEAWKVSNKSSPSLCHAPDTAPLWLTLCVVYQVYICV